MPGPVAPEQIDLSFAWKLGPFRVLGTLRGDNGPWLTRHDLSRRFDPFIDPHPSQEVPASKTLRLNATLDDTAWRRDGSRPLRMVVTPEQGCWRLSRSDLVATLTFNDALGWSLEGTMTPEGLLLDECLRVMLWSALLDQGDGLLVHGASAVAGGQGFCFPALSGTGKSTLIRTAPGDLALSDEISLLTRDPDGQWWIWPSPFWNWDGAFAPSQFQNGLGASDPYPLEALALLHQGTTGSAWMATTASDALASVLMNVVAFDTLEEASVKTVDLTIELLTWLEARQRLGDLFLMKGDDPYTLLRSAFGGSISDGARGA